MSFSGHNRVDPLNKGYPMAKQLRIVHYLNQFFGQIGGEDAANAPVQVRSGPVGPGMLLQQALREAGLAGEITSTVIGGDNTVAEAPEEQGGLVADLVLAEKPDLVFAGPCFNAGRYGMACGAVSRALQEKSRIPCIVGINEANPALDIYRADAFMIPVAPTAAKMRQGVTDMARAAVPVLRGEYPPSGTYFPQGVRQLVSLARPGAVRAVDLLLNRLNSPGDSQPVTELPLPSFDRVPPAEPVTELSAATIILGTEGGLTPADNPDKIEMSMATRWGRYSIQGMHSLSGALFTVNHGGYDNCLARENPNRLLPLDALKDLESEGVVGRAGEYFYTTAGNAASVDNARRFGREMAADIRERFKGQVGVAFTST